MTSKSLVVAYLSTLIPPPDAYYDVMCKGSVMFDLIHCQLSIYFMVVLVYFWEKTSFSGIGL